MRYIVTALSSLTLLLAVLPAQSRSGLSVKFDYETHYGVKRITVNGQQLLTGCGFGFIGSKSGIDDKNNITSCRPKNGGVMRPFNGKQSPYLEHQLHFAQKSGYPNRLYFGGQWGPSKYRFAALSMPTDGDRRYFTHWRDSSGAVGRYQDNPPVYRHPRTGQWVRIRFAKSRNLRWGEMIGRDYTVRVVVTGTTHATQLAFVDHPGIGVRNVEFGFVGGAKINQRANIVGYIEVLRTDSSVFNGGGGKQRLLTFEAESSRYHQTGRRERGGWSVTVRDRRKVFVWYGPYTTDVVQGRRTASFRIKLDNVTKDKRRRILTLDVYDARSGRILARRDLLRRDFKRAHRYQTFDLPFTAPRSSRLEFRVFYHGFSYVKIDRVQVR